MQLVIDEEITKINLRLGDADKALNHYKRSGKESNPKEMAKAQALRNQLARSIEARKLRDWKTVLKEAGNAVSSGADSAPQVFANSPSWTFDRFTYMYISIGESETHAYIFK